MKKDEKEIKLPISDDIVFRNMMIAVYAVSAIFFVKNLFSGTIAASVIIGVCMAIFSAVTFTMKKIKVSQKILQLVLCLGIVFLVFIISLFSGDYYSDDFPLYLCVIALSGMYLVPKYTIVQAVIIDILLMIAYFIHPNKADPLAQYLMCLFILTVCAICFYIVINRGRAYIRIGERRAKEAEELLMEIRGAGTRLQLNCEESVKRISVMEEINHSLETGVEEIREGSATIIQDASNVDDTFHDIRGKMQITQGFVNSLEGEVKNVEDSISISKQSMKEIVSDIQQLKDIMESTNKVFQTLHQEINDIVGYTKQLNKIATNTTTLALNASIEAARAGHMGAGFAVVANKVQLLSEDSNHCSAQIASVVAAMEELVTESTSRIVESDNAISHSVEKLSGFESSFKDLTKSFHVLHRNIEHQNSNIHTVDNSLEDLAEKIRDMAISSVQNQESVRSLTECIETYKENIQQIINDNIEINDLSVSLLGKG